MKSSINYSLYIIVIIISFVITISFSGDESILAFDSELKHQFWRLISAHFQHHNWFHMISNMLTFGLIIYLFKINVIQQLLVISISMLMVNVFLFNYLDGIYVGFSSLNYGLLTFGILNQFKRIKHLPVIVLFISGYLFYLSPQILLIDSQWTPLVEAHMIGITCGVVLRKF